MKQLFRPGYLLVLGATLAAVTFLVLWLVPSGAFGGASYILLPDQAHPVAPLVTVKGEKLDKDGGGIYFVDVIVREASLLEDVWPSIRTGATVVPASVINPPGVSDAGRRAEDLRQMVESQNVAAAVALRALGYKVISKPTGATITAVDPSVPAAGKLEPTQVIVAVDGVPVRTPTELRAQIGKHTPGDSVMLTLRTGSELKKVTVKTIASPADKSRPLIGIEVGQAAQIKLPFAVKIDSGQIGGPSAGLAFALDLMEELGRNVDRGYKVAATGEISLDGTVSPIGAVEQKTIGARQSHVDVFLVPAGDNAREAKRYADGLRIIPVESFQQALRALATLPPKP